jgi:hypothetical protein
MLTKRARVIASGGSLDTVGVALEGLAHDLVALADDLHASPESIEWLITEFNRLVDRLPSAFDRESAKTSAATALKCVGRSPNADTRDLFLIYGPQDRLPIAAPLAVELTKRRVSVAFAEFEVSSGAQVAAALEHGLSRHRGGVILATPAFERAYSHPHTSLERVRVVRRDDLPTIVEDLVAWAANLRVSKL